MRMLNELAEYPLMKRVRGSDSTDDEQATPPLSVNVQWPSSLALAVLREWTDVLADT